MIENTAEQRVEGPAGNRFWNAWMEAEKRERREIESSWTREGKLDAVKNYKGSPTFANGLAVPTPFAEKMILSVLRESKGTAMAVTDDAIKAAMKEMASEEGLLVCPEGAALLPALKALLANGGIDRNGTVLLLNTGSAYKYL